jgi:predicted Holliday junction resolvase-like endonuclease
MFISNGLFVAIVWIVLLILIEKSTAIHHKIDSLHKTSKITSDAFKNDSRLTEDLDKTFNTFKRKDDIGQTIKKPTGKAIKLDADGKRRTHVKQPAQIESQEFSKSRNVPERNAKRQYIYGLPSVMPSAGLIPRQFVTFPKPGLHTG